MHLRRGAPLLVILGLACATRAREGPPPAADARSVTAEIERQNARHTEAWLRNDANAVAALYAPNGALMFPGAPDARGRDAVRAMIAGVLAGSRVDTLEVRIDTIEVYGGTALQWGTFREVFTPGGGPSVLEEGRYLIQWQRQPDGRWAIRRFTGNSMRPPD